MEIYQKKYISKFTNVDFDVDVDVDVDFETEKLDVNSKFDFELLPRYTRLKKLIIQDCPLLTNISELPKTLTELWIYNCCLLTKIPELPKTLNILRCNKCYLLTCIPELPARLRKLHIYNCSLLNELPNLNHTALTNLDCCGCPFIHWLPELPTTLTILRCSQEYFIDKYDYDISTFSIEKYRNDPITEKRRDINGMLNPIFK